MDSRELFEILVREHTDLVRAFLLSCVRDPATVEELTQATFVAAWQSLPSYDRKTPFGPWVRGVAGRLLLAHRRRVGGGKLYFCDEEALAMLEQRFAELRDLPGHSTQEKLAALHFCLAGLSDDQRRVVEGYYQRGATCHSIAERLGVGVDAVKREVQRARLALLRCLRQRSDRSVLEGGAR